MAEQQIVPAVEPDEISAHAAKWPLWMTTSWLIDLAEALRYNRNQYEQRLEAARAENSELHRDLKRTRKALRVYAAHHSSCRDCLPVWGEIGREIRGAALEPGDVDA